MELQIYETNNSIPSEDTGHNSPFPPGGRGPGGWGLTDSCNNELHYSRRYTGALS